MSGLIYTIKTLRLAIKATIYREMSDASFRLYASAQGIWIANDMDEWVSTYDHYIQICLNTAKDNKILKKVFSLYEYDRSELEVPLLSILQHYGCPTPLMDLSYNINVALYFATKDVK